MVAGDFNSLPDSPVYQYLIEGYVSTSNQDMALYDYGSFGEGGLKHSLSIRSSYAHTLAGGSASQSQGEPPFTNYTEEFKGVIDYVLYSQQTLRCLQLLEPLDEDAVRGDPLPNAVTPSDHIHLLAVFEVSPHRSPALSPTPTSSPHPDKTGTGGLRVPHATHASPTRPVLQSPPFRSPDGRHHSRMVRMMMMMRMLMRMRMRMMQAGPLSPARSRGVLMYGDGHGGGSGGAGSGGTLPPRIPAASAAVAAALAATSSSSRRTAYSPSRGGGRDPVVDRGGGW